MPMLQVMTVDDPLTDAASGRDRIINITIIKTTYSLIDDRIQIIEHGVRYLSSAPGQEEISLETDAAYLDTYILPDVEINPKSLKLTQ